MTQWNTCIECGFTKECTEDEFMNHMFLHDELDAILEELGIVQEPMQFSISITPADDGGLI